MLKISESSLGGQTTLQLAGRLAGEWVHELRTACETAGADHRRVLLDFADVTFVDRAGAELIHGLLRKGISLINCSPFVTEQLKQSGSS
jgi:anti-anti-sigma regulatory factor